MVVKFVTNCLLHLIYNGICSPQAKYSQTWRFAMAADIRIEWNLHVKHFKREYTDWRLSRYNDSKNCLLDSPALSRAKNWQWPSNEPPEMVTCCTQGNIDQHGVCSTWQVAERYIYRGKLSILAAPGNQLLQLMVWRTQHTGICTFTTNANAHLSVYQYTSVVIQLYYRVWWTHGVGSRYSLVVLDRHQV